MPLALGIDTGGTYTDGVLLELSTGEVKKKAKAFTTRKNLALGIRECLRGLAGGGLRQVCLVALSTTLATNAIVEGRGCRVGLILIGHEATGDLPAQEVVVVGGGHDIKGRPLAALDREGLRQAVKKMQGKVDTLAISGYLSVRNPEHELAARAIVQENWPVPVVCAHQLTTTLGFYERTVTACLNARLLPVIAELLAAVKEVLTAEDIRAPLMVVKGDGSLMAEALAREKPIETILSGPAASIVGATFLTGSKRALILDMGGTTTDIAIVEEGRPRLNTEGATVGGWRTRVEAADISTFGLGGDSYIRVSPDRKLLVGPRRVWPLAGMARQFPSLVAELRLVDPAREIVNGQPADCWMLVRDSRVSGEWQDDERQVLRALADGPHNILTLAARVGRDPNLLPLRRLEQEQVVGRISFTPTDALHALGRFTPWNVAAAREGAVILARRMQVEPEEFLALAMEKVEAGISRAILQSLVNREGMELDLKDDPGASIFFQRFLAGAPKGGFGVDIHLAYPVVAIGAPVAAYLPAVARRFRAELAIPEHAEVANAVGAAAGQVVETVRVLIKPGTEGGFVVHAPWERQAFLYLDDAERYIMEKARQVAAANALRAGAADPQVLVSREEAVSRTAGTGEEVYLETRIQVTALGRPRGERYANHG
ncbi:hydantoinase/oxoprolinase family protein [Moorella naiadis]|uniref:hydantoinase/oxoprolinase family protein n=1 Tax=Moorella naiadis (nom. illeg.) TaxID=3093670 RepID=UPI003D9C82F1